MAVTTKNGTKPEANGEPVSGLNLGSPVNPSSTALALPSGGAGGLMSGVGALSLPTILGHAPTREERGIIEKTEAHALSLQGQAAKLRLALQEWHNTNQQVSINTAQTFSLLTALKHLSSDPDYQAWWGSWAKFQAERCVNTSDELMIVGARALAEIVAQPNVAPGELVALWRSLFAR